MRNASAPGDGLLRWCCLQLLEDVEAAGQQPSGDRGGGDVVAAAVGQLAVGAGDHGVALGRLGGLLQDPTHPHRARFGDVAVADLTVGVADLGVSPAQGAQLAGRGEAAESPISATNLIAVSRPTPGRAISAWTRGSGLASAAISRSSRAMGVARAASNPQQSSTTSRGTGGRARPASQARPGPVQRPRSWAMPRSASTACTRCLQAVDSRTRLARWRSSARRSRVAWGAIQASGNRSARSSCASGRASTVLELPRSGGHMNA
jgi:hypothetical protein